MVDSGPAVRTKATSKANTTAPGIGSQDVGRIFNPLFSTKSGGMGMGLSICRSIIEAHDDRLLVAPNAPRGSVFQFILGASTAASAAAS
jgi:signal transduction histidine kinase